MAGSCDINCGLVSVDGATYYSWIAMDGAAMIMSFDLEHKRIAGGSNQPVQGAWAGSIPPTDHTPGHTVFSHGEHIMTNTWRYLYILVRALHTRPQQRE
jgi:hypothetical protein